MRFNDEKDILTFVNGVARTLKNNAHQRKTTAPSNDSLHLPPFSKCELLKEKIGSQRERILSFEGSSL